MPASPAIAVGIITNNGPIDRPAQQGHALHPVDAASWATPIVYLQNTTGYMVGKEAEQRRHDQARLQDDPGA